MRTRVHADPLPGEPAPRARVGRGRSPGPLSTPPLSVSIVIPALNEAVGIAVTVASALDQDGPADVLVVDGGSSDDTAGAVSRAGVRVLAAPCGRARQMNAGATATQGDVLLFLHADTRLPPGALAAVRQALADPAVAGGCFRTTFDDARSPWMRLWQARLWMRWHRLAFGDRAPFVRRAVFDAAGGFPDEPLFEDLDLVRRVRRHGRFVFLDAAVTTSARRFRANGALGQQLLNVALWIGWNAGVAPSRLKQFYSDAARSGRKMG